MREGMIASLLLLAFTTCARAQFFDFFQPTRTYNVHARTTQRFEYGVRPEERVGETNIYIQNKNHPTSGAYVDTFRAGDDPFAYLLAVAEREESRERRRTTKPPKRLNSSQTTSKSRGNNNNNNRNHESIPKKKIVNSDVNSDNDIYKEIRPTHKITTKSPALSSHHISSDSSNRNAYDSSNYFENYQGRYHNAKPSNAPPANHMSYDRPEYETPDFGRQPIYSIERPSYSNRRPDFHEDRPDIYNRPDTTEYPIFINRRPDYNDEPNYNQPDPGYQDPNKPADGHRRPVQDPNDHMYTTERPFSGVKPVVAQGPPITNRPVHVAYTEEPVVTRGRPDDMIKFPGPDDGTPDLVQGPDVDLMPAAQRRRYEQVLDRKCESYASGDSEQGAAIPLLPSPSRVVFNVSRCPPQSTPLIVGGRRVTVEQFPHAAELGWPNIERGGYTWKCGGSLISEQFVLTAAHCAYEERDDKVVSGPPRVVQLGSSYLDDPGALVLRVRKVIRHPRYKIPRAYHDLALLKLFTRVEFSEVIKPACVGTPPPPGESIITIGWGRTAYSGNTSHELRGVAIPVWDLATCARALGTSRKLPAGPAADSQLCAGDERGERDTCQGDSGGGAVVRSGCRWAVVGVTSVGRACGAPRTPALYATPARAFIGAVLDQA